MLCQRWPFLRGRDAIPRHFLKDDFAQSLAAYGPWITTRDGWEMKANMGGDYTSQVLKLFGELEPLTKAFLLQHLGPRGVFLDIGANVGYFSLLLARHQPQSRVFAFEPNPAISTLLADSIERGGLGDRLSLHTFAASDSVGSVSFRVEGDNSGHSRLVGGPESAASAEQTLQVETVRLDDWLPPQLGGRQIQVVKIDVEGAELRVLRGMEKLLAQHRPALVVEAYDEHLAEFGDSCASLRSWLKAAGYVEEAFLGGNLHLVHRDAR
ncbi:hypothetical protein BGE01nite_38770 [Brevifollis gellanilyticus]|uniref:Methyltransferase FkbM domain-containing protein n=2 Tax=Brevifollis gellanilyticus TaxID=748831 RepID=A0A512MCY3_9BACT|nr:hypothetical protein BGE01nite_38770 [Brevifollis gellanilyticus]